MTESFIDGKTFDEFSQGLFTALIKCTKASTALPEAEDHQYYSTYPSFQAKTTQIGENLLHLKQRFLDHNQVDAKLDAGLALSIDNPLDASQLERMYNETIVDCVDHLLDQVDAYIDDCKGDKQSASLVTQGLSLRKQKQMNRLQQHTDLNLMRPQDRFLARIDNTYGHFIPKLTSKPNARFPLTEDFVSLIQRSAQEFKSFPKVSSSLEAYQAWQDIHSKSGLGNTLFPHPYDAELRALQYTQAQLEASPEQLYLPIETSQAQWIETAQDLRELVEVLRGQREIAIDLEHHNFRSYQGLTCLMQISTRKKDYLIDTLALWTHLECLNEVFTDPTITKVLHGANMDVEWLQRDFGLYLVNMFDTGQAARVLEFSSFSLAHLLQYFCKVTAEKQYQLADWRVRPLSDELRRYAQSDTHYLLYIYDRLRAEAVAKGNANNNLLLAILNRSRDVCLTVHDKLTPTAYMQVYENMHDGVLDQRQLRVYSLLFSWRDRIGREMDECVQYVLPNRIMFTLAKNMPTSAMSLLAACNPVPPVVRSYANDLVALIQDCIGKSLNDRLEPALAPVPIFPEKAKYNPQASPSPLTTEQLYNRAGWLEHNASSSGSGNAVSGSTELSVIAVLSKKNEGYTTRNPHHSSLYVSSDEVTTSDSDDDSGGSLGGEGRGKRLAATRIREKMVLVPHRLVFNDNADTEAGDEINLETVASVQAGNDAVMQPIRNNNELQAERKSDAPLKGDKSESVNDIPQSMVEIYQLSNKNRKNKSKAKPKKKADEMDAFERVDEIHATKRHKESRADDDGLRGVLGGPGSEAVGKLGLNPFLSTIGWLPQSNASNQQASHSGGSGSANTTPRDGQQQHANIPSKKSRERLGGQQQQQPHVPHEAPMNFTSNLNNSSNNVNFSSSNNNNSGGGVSYGGEIGSHQYGRGNAGPDANKKGYAMNNNQQQMSNNNQQQMSNNNNNGNQKNNNKGKNFRQKQPSEMNAQSMAFNPNPNFANNNANPNQPKQQQNKKKGPNSNAHGGVYRVVNK